MGLVGSGDDFLVELSLVSCWVLENGVVLLTFDVALSFFTWFLMGVVLVEFDVESSFLSWSLLDGDGVVGFDVVLVELNLSFLIWSCCGGWTTGFRILVLVLVLRIEGMLDWFLSGSSSASSFFSCKSLLVARELLLSDWDWERAQEKSAEAERKRNR